MPGRLRIYTSKDGSGSLTEVVRIRNNGIITNVINGITHFECNASFTAAGSSVTKGAIDLNALLGVGTGGTVSYTVHAYGYGSGGANGLNYTYTSTGFGSHNYSATNYGSFGAGTIQMGINQVTVPLITQ